MNLLDWDKLESQIPIYKIDEKGNLLVDGTPTKEVLFVLLGITRSRVLWPPGKWNKNVPSKPNCTSSDAIKPDGGMSPMPGPCETCEKAQWNKRTPPECVEIFTLFCFNATRQSTFKFQIKRTGIKALKALKESLKIAEGRVEPQAQNKTICVQIKLTTEPVANYFIPVFSITNILPWCDVKHLVSVAEKMLGKREREPGEDVEFTEKKIFDSKDNKKPTSLTTSKEGDPLLKDLITPVSINDSRLTMPTESKPPLEDEPPF